MCRRLCRLTPKTPASGVHSAVREGPTLVACPVLSLEHPMRRCENHWCAHARACPGPMMSVSKAAMKVAEGRGRTEEGAQGDTYVPVLLPSIVVVQQVFGSVQHHRPEFTQQQRGGGAGNSSAHAPEAAESVGVGRALGHLASSC